MSKEKRLELIICLISIIALVLAITTNVFAINDLSQLTGNNNANNNGAYSNIQDGNRNANNNLNNALNNNINNNVNNNINNNVNRNANNNANKNVTEMPDTGVDYSVVLIIAVCGASAVYAFKKIRSYNNI